MAVAAAVNGAMHCSRHALACRLRTGYNCSLFAYGQTGAGKSYSMMGYGEDKGIIPIACERIFDRIDSNTDPDLTIKVEASMLEIYMEKVGVRSMTCSAGDTRDDVILCGTGARLVQPQSGRVAHQE